ncbi:hypothetical protein BDP27DRAFT_1432201 [Rhodocollybia butyracea]|uniref:Uncharacterized protein n=1 Tax=Rhodocollybia butyracea TaxID=206335 RepID=A0A9P5P7R4_9AGAR|nr:hypothetical protein BDP27DRAFT_1432201 [Rhodocollybia butyracea]
MSRTSYKADPIEMQSEKSSSVEPESSFVPDQEDQKPHRRSPSPGWLDGWDVFNKAVTIHEAAQGDSDVFTKRQTKLNEGLNSARSGQVPSMRRSFRIPALRRDNFSRPDMIQLKGQLYSMLITFQVIEASVKRAVSVEGAVQDMSRRLYVLEGRATLGPPSVSVSPQPTHDNSGYPATSSKRSLGGSSAFSSGIENPVPGASTISPLAPSYQRDVSFRSNHVEGSSSTHSNVDNSVKENFNSTTHHDHFHFTPGNGVPPLPGPGPRYQSPAGLNTYGGNGGYGVYGVPTYGSDTGIYDGYNNGGNWDLASAYSGGNRNNYSGGLRGA